MFGGRTRPAVGLDGGSEPDLTGSYETDRGERAGGRNGSPTPYGLHLRPYGHTLGEGVGGGMFQEGGGGPARTSERT